MTASGMARGPAEKPPSPERTEETERERLEHVALFGEAARRCVAMQRFHELWPPVANPAAVASVWSETRTVVESWRSFAEREDRWYGAGWPHDVDRTRLHIGVALARALVDGAHP